jgi:hypothetical protein
VATDIIGWNSSYFRRISHALNSGTKVTHDINDMLGQTLEIVCEANGHADTFTSPPQPLMLDFVSTKGGFEQANNADLASHLAVKD